MLFWGESLEQRTNQNHQGAFEQMVQTLRCMQPLLKQGQGRRRCTGYYNDETIWMGSSYQLASPHTFQLYFCIKPFLLMSVLYHTGVALILMNDGLQMCDRPPISASLVLSAMKAQSVIGRWTVPVQTVIMPRICQLQAFTKQPAYKQTITNQQ